MIPKTAPRHPRQAAGRRRRSASPYSVAVNGAELRRQMQLRGLTAAEVARRARASGHKVAEATISNALNGRRIHPAKLQAIAAVLHEIEPFPGVDALLMRQEDADPEVKR